MRAVKGVVNKSVSWLIFDPKNISGIVA